VDSKRTEIARVIEQSAQTGLVIHFSELDIAVNPKNNPEYIYESSAQNELFAFVFKEYRVIQAKQQYGITFWNVSDKDTWLRGYFKRPKEYPLLFDDNYAKKSGYTSLTNALKTPN
jgi:endo-1,4-beta-xylanase